MPSLPPTQSYSASRNRARKKTASTRDPRSNAPTRILSVSPIQDDHSTLRSILWEHRWCFTSVDSFSAAIEPLYPDPPHIIVCERDLFAATWRDVLVEIRRSTASPLLIVTSRLADDYLWAEVLNLGGYDVLAKPFRAEEVRRVLEFASERIVSTPADRRRRRSSFKHSLVSGAGV